MVIAGGVETGAPQTTLARAASTEPAMVIAGGDGARARESRSGARFNGAGDGDRWRAEEAAHEGSAEYPASTEPAMVIAGGNFTMTWFAPASASFNGAGDGDRRREVTGGTANAALGLLQRSRRW